MLPTLTAERCCEQNASRQKLQETVNINLGLFALKRCIAALIRRQQAAAEGGDGKAVAVPYRDSKLTQLLAEALGGNAKTLIIVCAALEPIHTAETIQTLRFGEQCSTVHSGAAAEQSAVLSSAVAAIDAQIAETKELIKRDERWETRTRKVVSKISMLDNVQRDEAGTIDLADETVAAEEKEVVHEVQGQALVGAEKHHARLEKLLGERRTLLGEA